MVKYRRGDDREELLADVAEMYYDGGMTQDEISRAVGVTRSAISRMLSEARDRGIIEIHIRRPLRFDDGLETALVKRFGLQSARVLVWNKANRYDDLRARLGQVAAGALTELLAPNLVIGVAWGTAVSATIDAIEVADPVPVTVVQLVGVLGPGSQAFNAQALVQSLARKLGGEGAYLYTPFIVENEELARSLLNNQSIREIVELGKRCDIALLGIGTTDPQFCTVYQGGHISRESLEILRGAGAVGDVSGRYFDINGVMLDIDFHSRLVGIAREDLLGIPIRLGVAGGDAKVRSILGALRGGYVNRLVTDSRTAAQVLELAARAG